MKRLFVGAWVGLGLLGTGCDSGGDAREKLQLGMVLPSTGSSAATGTRQIEGATLAVEEINAGPGVLGKDLELVYRDDNSDKAKGPEVAQELIDLGVPAIIGSGPSSITLAIADVTIPAKVVQVAGSSTSPLISSKADDGFLFRTAPSDALQGKLLARRAYARGHRTVSIIHAPGAYGAGLADAFKSSFEAAGGTVPANKEYVEKQSETDYNNVLAELYAAGAPDAVVLIGALVDATNVLKAYVNNHAAKGTFWYFTDSISVSELVTGVGASAFTFEHEGTKPASPSTPAFGVFQSAYESRYGKAPETFAANAYDAVYLLALALEAAGAPDGTAVRDTMTSVSTGGTQYTPSDLTAALAAAGGGEDVDFNGASGPVDFDSHGDVLGNYDIWVVQGGAITVKEASVSAE